MPSAEQTQNWDKEEKWFDSLGRSTDKPSEDRNGTIIYIRAVMLPKSTQLLIFFDSDIVELEGRQFPHGHLFQL